MNRPKLIRSVRIAWSVAWGLLAVLLCVLWVRSHYAVDLVMSPDYVTSPGMTDYIEFYSFPEHLDLCWRRIPGKPRSHWIIRSTLVKDLEKKRHFPPTTGLGLNGWMEKKEWLIRLPYWLVVPVSAIFAVAPFSLRSFRFSLRTLLIATTLIAVVLGMIVWMSRAG